MFLHIDRFVKTVVSVDRSKYNCCYSDYPLVSCNLSLGICGRFFA